MSLELGILAQSEAQTEAVEPRHQGIRHHRIGPGSANLRQTLPRRPRQFRPVKPSLFKRTRMIFNCSGSSSTTTSRFPRRSALLGSRSRKVTAHQVAQTIRLDRSVDDAVETGCGNPRLVLARKKTGKRQNRSLRASRQRAKSIAPDRSRSCPAVPGPGAPDRLGAALRGRAASSVFCFDHRATLALERSTHELSRQWIVLDEQDRAGGHRSLLRWTTCGYIALAQTLCDRWHAGTEPVRRSHLSTTVQNDNPKRVPFRLTPLVFNARHSGHRNSRSTGADLDRLLQIHQPAAVILRSVVANETRF